ncbi:hypothetical protein HDU96_003943 [Phlyctochytrium bullatum]|nr:hypothetical protein HDU96_003943 [Phlyctochytrium bullatum]
MTVTAPSDDKSKFMAAIDTNNLHTPTPMDTDAPLMPAAPIVLDSLSASTGSHDDGSSASAPPPGYSPPNDERYAPIPPEKDKKSNPAAGPEQGHSNPFPQHSPPPSPPPPNQKRKKSGTSQPPPKIHVSGNGNGPLKLRTHAHPTDVQAVLAPTTTLNIVLTDPTTAVLYLTINPHGHNPSGSSFMAILGMMLPLNPPTELALPAPLVAKLVSFSVSMQHHGLDADWSGCPALAASVTVDGTSGGIRMTNLHTEAGAHVALNANSGLVELIGPSTLGSVTCRTSSGSIRVEQAHLEGAISLNANSGGITTKDLNCCGVDLRTTSGHIKVARLTSLSTANRFDNTSGSSTLERCIFPLPFTHTRVSSTSGFIRLAAIDTALGTLSVTSTSGSPTIDSVAAAQLDVGVTSGPVKVADVRVTGVAPEPAPKADGKKGKADVGGVTLNSTSGSIKVAGLRLLPGAPAAVRASTSSGHLTMDIIDFHGTFTASRGSGACVFRGPHTRIHKQTRTFIDGDRLLPSLSASTPAEPDTTPTTTLTFTPSPPPRAPLGGRPMRVPGGGRPLPPIPVDSEEAPPYSEIDPMVENAAAPVAESVSATEEMFAPGAAVLKEGLHSLNTATNSGALTVVFA